MTPSFPALLALVPLSFATPGDAVQAELARLDGAWQVVGHETDGKAANEEFWRQVRFVFKGDQLTFKGDDVLSKKVAKVTLVVDPSTTPRVIDLKVVEGESESRRENPRISWGFRISGLSSCPRRTLSAGVIGCSEIRSWPVGEE